MQRFLTLRFSILVLILFLNAYIWYEFLHYSPQTLRVSILNIGQGDSILVQGPTGIQMLVDGGPDRSVLRQLPKEMGLFDRSIDLIVETHPDSDHISGLIDVFDTYKITYFISPGIPDMTATARALDVKIDEEPKLHSFIARRGMRIHLGGGAYADVLYPDRDVSHGETNEGSVVMHLVYGTTSFMLTGDAPSDIEDHLVALDAHDGELPTTVLKAGHHGSKYSTNDAWLNALQPAYVAISAGEGNRYGHPNLDTIARIKREGAQIVSTIDHGTIRFVSNGRSVVVK